MTSSIRVLLSKQALQIQLGEQAELILTIHNQGQVVARYNVTVEGLDRSWVELSPAEVALFPQDQAQVSITLRPGSAPARSPRHYEAQVQVISQEDESERADVSLHLEVQPGPAGKRAEPRAAAARPERPASPQKQPAPPKEATESKPRAPVPEPASPAILAPALDLEEPLPSARGPTPPPAAAPSWPADSTPDGTLAPAFGVKPDIPQPEEPPLPEPIPEPELDEPALQESLPEEMPVSALKPAEPPLPEPAETTFLEPQPEEIPAPTPKPVGARQRSGGSPVPGILLEPIPAIEPAEPTFLKPQPEEIPISVLEPVEPLPEPEPEPTEPILLEPQPEEIPTSLSEPIPEPALPEPQPEEIPTPVLELAEPPHPEPEPDPAPLPESAKPVLLEPPPEEIPSPSLELVEPSLPGPAPAPAVETEGPPVPETERTPMDVSVGARAIRWVFAAPKGPPEPTPLSEPAEPVLPESILEPVEPPLSESQPTPAPKLAPVPEPEEPEGPDVSDFAPGAALHPAFELEEALLPIVEEEPPPPPAAGAALAPQPSPETPPEQQPSSALQPHAEGAAPAAGTAPLELRLEPQPSPRPGEGAFKLHLRNLGPTALTAQLEADDPEQACWYIVDPHRAVVPAGGEQSALLRLRPKEPASGGNSRSYTFTVTARPSEMPELYQAVQGSFSPAPPSLELALQPERPRDPREGAFRLHLRNPGATEITVQLEANDPAGSCWYMIDPPRLIVPTGGEQSALLRLRPKEPLSGVGTRAIHFTVSAQDVDAPQTKQQVQGQFEQTPPSLGLALQPASPRSPMEGAFSLLLRNPGASELTVQVEAADPAQACWYIVDPPRVVVPAGGEQSALLRLRPKRPPAGSGTRTFHFTVMARPLEAPEQVQQVQGEWVWAPQPSGQAPRPDTGSS